MIHYIDKTEKFEQNKNKTTYSRKNNHGYNLRKKTINLWTESDVSDSNRESIKDWRSYWKSDVKPSSNYEISVVEPETIQSAKKLLEIAKRVNESNSNMAESIKPYNHKQALQPVFESHNLPEARSRFDNNNLFMNKPRVQSNSLNPDIKFRSEKVIPSYKTREDWISAEAIERKKKNRFDW